MKDEDVIYFQCSQEIFAFTHIVHRGQKTY